MAIRMFSFKISYLMLVHLERTSSLPPSFNLLSLYCSMQIYWCFSFSALSTWPSLSRAALPSFSLLYDFRFCMPCFSQKHYFHLVWCMEFRCCCCYRCCSSWFFLCVAYRLLLWQCSVALLWYRCHCQCIQCTVHNAYIVLAMSSNNGF